MAQTWRNGSTVARTAADLELADAAALHAAQHAPGGTDPINSSYGVIGSGAALPALPATEYPSNSYFVVLDTPPSMWRSDGTTWTKMAALPTNFVPADLDGDMYVWDDPLGIGMAATGIPSMANSVSSNFLANRATWNRLISGSTIGKIYYYVFTSAGNVDVGIYTNTGSRELARPNTRAFSTGSIPCPAAGNVAVTVSPAVTCQARRHWFAMTTDAATNSFVCYSNTIVPVTFVAGWAAYKDTSFPLPATATGTSPGISRHVAMVGRPT